MVALLDDHAVEVRHVYARVSPIVLLEDGKPVGVRRVRKPSLVAGSLSLREPPAAASRTGITQVRVAVEIVRFDCVLPLRCTAGDTLRYSCGDIDRSARKNRVAVPVD